MKMKMKYIERIEIIFILKCSYICTFLLQVFRVLLEKLGQVEVEGFVVDFEAGKLFYIIC